MMKRYLLSAAAFLLFMGSALSQERTHVRYDTRAEILATPAKACGEYYMYEMDLPSPTKPPRGYKPIYISHIGRHGARYSLESDIFEATRDILARAHADGKLTYRGERLYQDYESFYPKVARRGGELTQKGQEQHRQIARRMIRDYPDVFKGQTHAEVISTNVHRVIISMISFLNEVDWRVRDFDYHLDAGNIYLPVLVPENKSNPDYVKPKPYPEKTKADFEQFVKEKRQWDAFCAKFFNDLDYLEKNMGCQEFQADMWFIISGLQCVDFDAGYIFADVFTPNEFYNFWETRNLNEYLRFGNNPFTDDLGCNMACTILKDIIEKADEDLASNRKTDLRLRFSHDLGIMPLLSFMDIDNFGARVDDMYEVANYWRYYEVPMASNVQFVFFRSKNNPEILVKVLLNGRETALPFKSVSGPFYAWNDFKAYYEPRIAEAEAFIARYKQD